MNDTELDTLARSAAADVRCEAGRIADSQNALQVLLGDVDAARDEPAASDAEIIELDNVTPIRRRPIWLPLTAAAAMVAAIAGVVFLTNGSDEGPAVSTNPITIPVTTPVVVPDPEPAPITSEPTITVEATPVEPTQPVDEGAVEASEGVIDVPDARGPQLERTVLASYEVGSGDGELGFEQCQECEPLTPWAPVVTDDGTVVVADALNGRWMIHRDGAWTSLPYRDGEVVTSAPVVGPDGLMYAMVADTFNQAAARFWKVEHRLFLQILTHKGQKSYIAPTNIDVVRTPAGKMSPLLSNEAEPARYQNTQLHKAADASQARSASWHR